MASAVDQLINGYNTSSPVSFDDYYHAYNSDNHAGDTGAKNPYGFFGSFQNLLFGNRTSAEKDYNKYLSSYEQHQNALLTARQNAETYAREDSQIQRLMADYKAAGLNPYLLLNSGNISGGVVSSQASRSEYKRPSSSKSSSEKKSVVSSAIKVIALLAMMAS